MVILDAKGKACPMPVILAKKELDAGAHALTVEVDNLVAVENLTRLGESSGYGVAVGGGEGCYRVELCRNEEAAPAEQSTPAPGSWVLFVGNEGVGTGSPELGSSLMTMFFYTLTQGDSLPSSILFMNGGVKLPTQNEQIVEHLKALKARGCEILVCGACLNYHQLADHLLIGTVSNMYEISSRMLASPKVISF